MRTKESGSHLVAVIVPVLILALVGVIGYRFLFDDKGKRDDPGANSAQFSSDAVTLGKYLSHNQCEGEGAKQLGSAPMKTADISTILPYGLVVGGHVTPVDHQYFYGTNQRAAASTYDVLAPADGRLVNIEVRPKGQGPSDVRGVISYSCTFFSYFDLTNSLSAEIAAQMPAGWQTKNGPQKVNIAVKQRQVVAKVGGQSLDFAVWDTTKQQTKLLVPKAYANYEPWKIATVAPTDYYSDDVTSALLPYYVRKDVPRDGVLAYDSDGKAVGGWFKRGTNGYIGAFKHRDFNPMVYADGHFALVPDYLDPSGWVLSTGAINHGQQYTIKSPSVTPDKLDKNSGLVKYELAQYEHFDESGSRWMGTSVPSKLRLNMSGQTMATALVQQVGTRELKVEVFQNKQPDQVSGFTSSAITYDRGDKATTMQGPDAR